MSRNRSSLVQSALTARLILIWSAFWLAAVPLFAFAGSVSERLHTDNVSARLIAERARIAPGESVDLALVLDIRPHWHTYWRNPGDSGEPPRIEWHLPAGVAAGPIRWPTPALIPVGPLANYGYSERATHLVELAISEQWPVGKPVIVRADATWLVCQEACVPEHGSFKLTLATGATAAPADPAVAGIFTGARSALPVADIAAAELVRGDPLLLRVPAAALPLNVTSAHFFANAWGLVEHAAGQRWRIVGDELVLELTPGATPDAVSPSGLLVVEAAGSRTSYEVNAHPSLGVAAGSAGINAESYTKTGSGADARADVGGPTGSAPAMGIPLALLFALLGGLALNLMPCVFPVLAIKALGLASQGGASAKTRWLHALAYAAGVLTFFLLVALLLLGLRAGGAAVGWGFQLQSPVFVALMAYLFLVIGLSLAGAVTIGTRLMGIGRVGHALSSGSGSNRHARKVHIGDFVTGALAALVAAPCTAPFMGAALGYAVTLPWPPALAIMLTLGLGMALPFMALALLPRLADRLPRPGPWMEHLKQLLSFPMFATAAWLVWVLSIQTGSDGVAAILAGMVALSLALWLLERTRNAAGKWRQTALGSAVLAFAAALWLGIGTARLDVPAALTSGTIAEDVASPTSRFDVAPYRPETLNDARSAGRAVFVNMTAAWCITCLVNERVALSGASVARAFAKRDVLYLKGDWTNRDPAITDYLAGFGRNGVPIYVFYPEQGEPRVLPQLLTESIVLKALEGV